MGFFPGFGRKPDKSPQAPPPGTPPTEFDELAFSDHVQDFGRAYRHRTTELIRICQRFFGPADQSFDQNKALSKVLDMCDRTIEGAMKSRKKGSIEVDDLFVMATKDLQEYELDFLKRRTVIAAMADATKKDKRKRRDSPRPNDDKFVNVEFRIMSSLPCKNPIIVKQRLSSTTGLIVLAEILRNFSHFPKESRQRLCLAQNPRFYTASDLPEAPSGYKGSFSRQPTEKYEGTIYVLTNNLDPESGHSRRVFFEFGGQKRAFDNFWDTNKTLIFKDVSTGNLAGEALVERSIPAGTISYRMIDMKPTNTPSEAKAKHTRDWKFPIRELHNDSSHTHLCIGAGAETGNASGP